MSGRAGPGPLAGLAVVGICLVLVLSTVPTAQAAHQEDPNLTAYVPDPTVEPGTTMELTVQLENDADSLEYEAITAENVRATMGSGDSPIVVESGTQVVEPIANEAVVPVTFRIRVPRDIAAGEYTLPIDVSFTFTEHANTKSRDVTLEPTVRVDDRARFAVVSSDSDVAVGDTGTLNVTVENVGSAPALDGTMTLTTNSGAVTVGGAEADSRYLGRLAPGERRTVAYEASVSGDANAQSFALTATVDYEDTEGTAKTSSALSIALRPRAEQSFSVRDVDSTLRVGEQGTVSGAVVNEGPGRVSDAVAILSTAGSTLEIVESEYALGGLEAGEAADFSFDVETGSSAGGGPRQLSLEVRYRNTAGDRRTSEPLDVNVDVAPERDVFSVAPASATVAAGGSDELVLRVTNAGDEPVTDVSAKLFTNAPVSSANDEAFVSSLAPGEATNLSFEVSAAAGAQPKTYPVSVDFQYDDADGDTLLSDTYRVPVTVVESAGGGPPVLPVVLLVLLLVGLGALYLRRTGRWPPWG